MRVDPPPPGLIRRLAAIVYDSLLLAGVLIVAGLPLPALPEAVSSSLAGQLSVRVYLLFVCALFFCWFWTHGGQTLGMRAWRLRVVGPGGAAVRWPAALARFFSAALSWLALGAGFWWSLVDRDRLTWHDRISNTRLIRVPKDKG